MLFSWLPAFSEDFQFFNLFRYITFRTGGAMITSLLLSFIIGPFIIRWLKNIQNGASNVREYTPEAHLLKSGTPSMGGVLILISILFSTMLWADLSNTFIWIVLLIAIGYGCIGLIDDWLKISKKNSAGLSGRYKLLGQIFFACIGIFLFINEVNPEFKTSLALPFVKDYLIDLGYMFIPFAIIVIIGTSNAVNLTDGLDGLAIVPIMIAASCYGLIAYLVGNAVYAPYLSIPYIAGTGEVSIIAGAMVGSAMGFLWFNAPPASVFMGDTGSLSLGGALGAMAFVTKHELVLIIIGGVFVMETLSVIIQVISFKTTGKRVFAMAPIHHHFEKKGWAESTIVVRFWIIAILLGIIGLSTLKIR